MRVLAEGLRVDVDRLGIAFASGDLRLTLRIGNDHHALAVGIGADLLRQLEAFGAGFLRLAFALRAHAVVDRLAGLLGIVGPAYPHIDDLKTQPFDRLVHLDGHFVDDGLALYRQDVGQRGVTQRPAQCRVDDRGQPLAGAELVTHRLVEQQRIGNAEAGIAVHIETLLIDQDDLLAWRVQIQHAQFIALQVLDEGQLHMQPRLTHDALGFAELQHQDLFGLMHGEQRAGGDDTGDNDQAAQDRKQFAWHGVLP